MARNVEIKARVDDVAALMSRAAVLADQGPTEIFQDDTFFRCETGRLKLRAFADASRAEAGAAAGELIFYRRDNQLGPKESFYVRAPTASPDSLREVLSLAYGRVGRVVKHRTLFLAGRTRIHVDRVEQLGDFLELEVVLDGTEDVDAGVREARRLMDALGIRPDQLVDGAYIDLLKCESVSPHDGTLDSGAASPTRDAGHP